MTPLPPPLPMSRVTGYATSRTGLAIIVPLRKRPFAVKQKTSPFQRGNGSAHLLELGPWGAKGRTSGEALSDRQRFFPVTAPLLMMWA